MIKPDPAWNIDEYRHIHKRGKRFNGKKYWLNVFNRKLRRVLNVFIRKDDVL